LATNTTAKLVRNHTGGKHGLINITRQ